MIANRVMPAALTSRAAAASASGSPPRPATTELAAQVAGKLSRAPSAAPRTVDAAVVDHVLARVAESFHDVALVATREAERRAELAAVAPQVFDIEAQPSDVHDLAGLLAIVAGMREPAD